MEPCIFEYCDHPKRGQHGYCNGHRIQLRRGETLRALRPFGAAAEARFWAKVNKTSGDGCWTWAGATMSAGYGAMKGNGGNVLAHRFSAKLHGILTDEAMHIDHICGNRACVQPAHLRQVTPKQNTEHSLGLLPTNTSGHTGAYFHRKSGRYVAQVVHAGAHHYLGLHATASAAGEVAKAKRNELFTHNDMDRVA